MLVLTQLFALEYLKPVELVHVLHKLQEIDAPDEDKERLLKEWGARTGVPIVEWMIKSAVSDLAVV